VELFLRSHVFILIVLYYKCTLTHLFNPHSLWLELFKYIYYGQCSIFDAICRAVSRAMNFDNPQNTLYNTVELHLSKSRLSGSPIVLFGLAFLVYLSRILHD